MKKIILMTLAAAAIIAITPRVLGNAFSGVRKPQTQQEFTLTLTDTQQDITVSAQEYLIGCLYAQIDVSYHIEALKAQAAAAYTYALKLVSEGKELSDSPSLCQPYFTPAKAKEYYGDSYEKYLENVKTAAAYGASHPIYYENKPIYSVYHSVSAGATARPEYIWGLNLPYLAKKSCPGDVNFKSYYSFNEMSSEEMRQKLLDYDPTLQMPLDYSLWFTEFVKDENGYVETVEVGGKSVSGGDLWRILGLRSTAFDIEWTGMAFKLSTRGYGHGAGMSQYAADTMAKSGKTAKEILEYFYDGAEVAELSE